MKTTCGSIIRHFIIGKYLSIQPSFFNSEWGYLGRIWFSSLTVPPPLLLVLQYKELQRPNNILAQSFPTTDEKGKQIFPSIQRRVGRAKRMNESECEEKRENEWIRTDKWSSQKWVGEDDPKKRNNMGGTTTKIYSTLLSNEIPFRIFYLTFRN